MEEHWAPELPPGRRIHLPGRGPLVVREVPGPPGAPAVVLLHGWTVSSDLNWFGAFEPLGEHFRVVAFDHHGHGQGIRNRRRFRLADCADDAAAVADELGIERFIAVGYSMGGPISTLLWKRHRQRVAGLVLCASARNFAGTPSLAAQFAVFRPASWLARALPERASRPLFDRVIWRRTRGRGLRRWVIDEIRSGDPRTVLEAGTELGRFDNAEWIVDIDVPTAVLIATEDTILAPWRQERLAASLKGASVWRLEGDHDLCVRHPRRFARALVAACADVAHRAGLAPGHARAESRSASGPDDGRAPGTREEVAG